MGDFIVEWHLAADLKTLKCLFGCDQGPNTKFPCLYCLKKKEKQKNANSYRWEGGPLACRCNVEPNRDKDDSKWAPILKIPLSHVHICTLHVEMRILDKLIHMHICYAWNMGNRDQSSLALKKIEDIFNNLRVQGGNVHIVKDNELSGKSHYVPCKISIGGAKARHFLSAPIDQRTSGKWELWKDLCATTTSQTNNGSKAQEYKDVWINLDEMVMIMR